MATPSAWAPASCASARDRNNAERRPLSVVRYQNGAKFVSDNGRRTTGNGQLRKTMPQVIACPKCQTRMQVPDNAAGKQVRCPTCKDVFTIPAPALQPVGAGAAAAPAPPPASAAAPRPAPPPRPPAPTESAAPPAAPTAANKLQGPTKCP